MVFAKIVEYFKKRQRIKKAKELYKNISERELFTVAFNDITENVEFSNPQTKQKIFEELLSTLDKHYGWQDSCTLFFNAGGIQTWTWKELDENREYFLQDKMKWPCQWLDISTHSKTLGKDLVLREFKANDLRKMLKDAQIAIPSRARKVDLFRLAGEIPNIDKWAVYQDMERRLFVAASDAAFYLLLQDIYHRYNSLEMMVFYALRGDDEFVLTPHFAETADLFKKQHELRPGVIPPLFPGDRGNIYPK